MTERAPVRRARRAGAAWAFRRGSGGGDRLGPVIAGLVSPTRRWGACLVLLLAVAATGCGTHHAAHRAARTTTPTAAPPAGTAPAPAAARAGGLRVTNAGTLPAAVQLPGLARTT